MFDSNFHQIVLVLIFIGLVVWQQTQIVTLQSEVNTFTNNFNISNVSNQVQGALRATETLKVDLSNAQQSFQVDMKYLDAFSNNATAMDMMSKLKKEIDNQSHNITVNRAYNDSFMNMIAIIFVVFTVIISFYHIKLHDDNLKEIEYSHSSSVWQDENFYEFCRHEEGKLSPILILPPIYAMASLLSIIFPGSALAGGFTDFAEIMQSISIWYFVKLLDHTMRFIASEDEIAKTLPLSDDVYDMTVLSEDDVIKDKKLVALLAYYFEKYREEREAKELSAKTKGFVCLGFVLDFTQHFVENTNILVDNVKWCVYDFGCMVITCDKLSYCMEFSRQAALRRARGYEEVCCSSVDDRQDVRRAKAWLLHSKVYTRQFVFLRFVLAVFHLLFFTTDSILQLPPAWESYSNVFIIAVDVIIMTLAFWAIEQFLIDGPKDILVDNRPDQKCFIFQVLVVYTFFQEILLTVLVYVLDKMHYDVGIDAETINNFFVCTEMFIISILHMFVYPIDEWQEGYLQRSREQRKIQAIGVVSSLETFYKRAPILGDAYREVEMLSSGIMKMGKGGSPEGADNKIR